MGDIGDCERGMSRGKLRASLLARPSGGLLSPLWAQGPSTQYPLHRFHHCSLPVPRLQAQAPVVNCA